MSVATDNSGNPILEQFSEDGFIDCAFRVSDLVESSDYFSFHISASSEMTVLGMDVAIRKEIDAGFDSEMNLIK